MQGESVGKAIEAVKPRPARQRVTEYVVDTALLSAPLVVGWLLCARDAEFPVSDDWAYARSVERWLDSGTLRISGWAVVSLVAQAAWGLLFCKILGFSFAALRLAVSIWTVAGAACTYAMVRELSGSRAAALLAGCAVVVNPLLLQWSYSFMTDGTFVGVTACALGWFVLAARRQRFSYLWIASCFGLAAALTRQTGLLVPFAVALCVPFFTSGPLRHRIWPILHAWIAVLLLPAIGFAIYLWWFLANHPAPESWRTYGETLSRNWASGAIVVTTYGAAMLVGLFLLPLLPPLVAWFWHLWRGRQIRTAEWICFGTIAAILFAPQWIRPGRACLTYWPGNQFRNVWLAPAMLHDNLWGIQGDAAVRWPIAVWQVLTVPALATTVLVLFALWVTLRSAFRTRAQAAVAAVPLPRDSNGLCVMCLSTGLAIAAFMLFVFWVHFERYWLCLLVPLAVTIATITAAQMTRPVLALSACLAIGLFTLSLVLVHDYFAWNRERWRLLGALEAQGIWPDQIDGGVEYNGWWRSAVDMQMTKPPRPADVPVRIRNLWWVVDDEYCVAFTDLSASPSAAPPGEYELLRTGQWFSWSVWQWRPMYVLRRVGTAQVSPSVPGEPG